MAAARTSERRVSRLGGGIRLRSRAKTLKGSTAVPGRLDWLIVSSRSRLSTRARTPDRRRTRPRPRSCFAWSTCYARPNAGHDVFPPKLTETTREHVRYYVATVSDESSWSSETNTRRNTASRRTQNDRRVTVQVRSQVFLGIQTQTICPSYRRKFSGKK